MNIDATISFLPTIKQHPHFTEMEWRDTLSMMEGKSIKLPYMPVVGWHIDICDFLWQWAYNIRDTHTLKAGVVKFIDDSIDFKIAHVTIGADTLYIYLDNPAFES
jgi:hypothetical protein